MTRSRYGSVRKRDEGKWQVRYRDKQGQDHYRLFPSKTEADGFLSVQHADILRGDWVNPNLGKITVEDWAKVWRATQRNLRPSTERLYDTLLRNHVLPALGQRTLASISVDDVEAWIAELLAKDGLSSTTANRAFRVLRQMLKVAVRRKRIPFSPCDGVHPPRDARTEMLFLTPAQVADLADGIDRHHRTLVLMAVYSGLRWGELAGLKVARLDLINRRVAVVEQLSGGRTSAPKTDAGRRVVTLPLWLMPHLEEEIAGKSLRDYVFTACEGGPLTNPSNFTRRVWKPAVRNSLPPELHALRFHDLRHTAVAIAIASGAAKNPKALQMRMGHSSITLTLDRYGHLLPGQDAEIADGMADPFALAQKASNVVPIR